MDSQNSLQLAKMKNSSQQVRDHAFKMEAVRKNLMPPVDKAKKLRESCEGFESIFIQKIWEQMRATIPEGGLLKGREEKFWQGMYDQELSKTMAGAGGIGLADMMYEQLSRNLSTASKNTADAQGGQPSGFAADLTPAPLIRDQAPQTPKTDAQAAAPVPQQKNSALAGLYSEVRQPDASGAPMQNTPGLPGAAPAPDAQSAAEDDTDPAIVAVLKQLRAAHQAVPSTSLPAGSQGLIPGAHPPLTPAHSQAPDQQVRTTFVSTLTKPVHKPVSGKRTVLPRAVSGGRQPTDQPVHRNLPYAMQQTQQAQAEAQLARASQPAPAGAVPGPDASKAGG
jgi:Rod binding domain-containing protein